MKSLGKIVRNITLAGFISLASLTCGSSVDGSSGKSNSGSSNNGSTPTEISYSCPKGDENVRRRAVHTIKGADAADYTEMASKPLAEIMELSVEEIKRIAPYVDVVGINHTSGMNGDTLGATVAIGYNEGNSKLGYITNNVDVSKVENLIQAAYCNNNSIGNPYEVERR